MVLVPTLDHTTVALPVGILGRATGQRVTTIRCTVLPCLLSTTTV